MVLFNDALEHLTRIHRILRMHRGHALVVGTSGSGKQSVIRLASFAANCQVFEINLSRGYNENMFRDDLKRLYNIIGVENKKIVFLFTASHIVDESFLELINNMLMTGLVATLFSDEEKDIIISSCRDTAVKAGFDITKLDLKTLLTPIFSFDTYYEGHVTSTMFLSGRVYGHILKRHVSIIYALPYL